MTARGKGQSPYSRRDAGDESAWRRLRCGYVAFYNVDVPEDVTARTWSRLFDPCVLVFCRPAERNGEVVGFAVSTLHPSTWTSDLNCYLEDLFVDSYARGLGTGRALIDDLLELADKKGWSRVCWHTNADNETARRL